MSLFCAGDPLEYHLKPVMFSLEQKQALNMCSGTSASFFIIPFKPASFKEKAAAGRGPYIPLPWPLLSFDQLTFPLNHSKQPCFEKGNVYWRFGRLISSWAIPL